MRFIIREQEYETLLAAGKYLFQRPEGPTGAVEYWRLTEAIDGYSFLRVDVDDREGSGSSTLYHVTIDPDGKIARLKFRYYGSDKDVMGDLLVEGDLAILNLQIDGLPRTEQHASSGSGGLIWFPSVIGLGLLARSAKDHESVPSIVLDGEQEFVLKSVDVHLLWKTEVPMVVARESLLVRPCLIRWLDQKRTIWFDNHNLPVKMARNSELIALEHHFVRHMQYDRSLND